MSLNPKQQRHKTSVFSEYQNNSNNSISSKQLQYWLMQMAPTSHTSPKFNHQNKIHSEWNLASTSSRYQTEGMTFGQSEGVSFGQSQDMTFGQRLDTFQSANKENMLSRGNLLIIDNVKQLKQSNPQHYQSQKEEKLTKSKSYINAMQQLQKRAKTLEQQNSNMRKSLQLMQQEKMSSLQSSMVYEEQIKSRVCSFQQKEKRAEQLKKENKRLRDGRNEQSLKIKLMEKAINEQKGTVKEVHQRLDILSQQNQALTLQLTEANNLAKTLLVENKQLVFKTQTLQNMKEKSTNSILEKYAKALQRIEELQLTLGTMKNRENATDEKTKKIIEQKDQKHLQLLETINGLNLEKQHLFIKQQNLTLQLQQKDKTITNHQTRITQFQQYYTQRNTQINTYLTKFQSTHQKYTTLSLKYAQLKSKCKSLREQLKVQSQTLNKYKKIKEQQNQERKYNEVKKEKKEQQYQDKSLIDSQSKKSPEKIKMSKLIGQEQHSEENTPVEKYDSSEDQYEHSELDLTACTKPLSIIVNAKTSEARIRSEEDQQSELKQNQQNFDQSEEDNDTTTNKMYDHQMRRTINKNQIINIYDASKNTLTQSQRRKSSDSKQCDKQQKLTKNQTQSRRNSTSKQSKQSNRQSKYSQKESTTYRKRSPQQPKYKIPTVQKSIKQKKQKQSFEIKSTENRSKSSSMERKKSQEKKSTSVDSNRQSKSISKQQPSSYSRLINDKNSINDQVYMYQSAQPTRYPHNERYYYSGEINNHQQSAYGLTQLNPHSFHHTSFQQQQNNSSLMTHESKNQLNKALLLQYQEEALKLYEEHERLLEVSSEKSISNDERAEILGRIRQVMLMIDHNTEKIFALRGKAD